MADLLISSHSELHYAQDMASRVILTVCFRPGEGETKDEENISLKLCGTEMMLLTAAQYSLVRMSHMA